ncbi:MAG: TIGR03960 family B12-binding radical SAM protein [Candidatus Brocadiaceae bacterium]|nr:TIGR03960 family B12-binding radical SAM protein [Candidatus Brocadiaceae bacterium]
MNSSFKQFVIENILPFVETPGQYIGGEWNTVRKDHANVRIKFLLAFPDTYSIGMSHMGLQILYGLLNEREDTVCERVFAPLVDMELLMRKKEIPLFSLETYTPANAFDVVGFSVQYELSYTNILNMLDLSGIPVVASERGEKDPIVIAGGPSAISPEPLADFVDIFFVGDGEESISELIDIMKDNMYSGSSRKEKITRIARTIKSVYVPSMYEVFYLPDNTIKEIFPKISGIPAKIQSASVKDLNQTYYPTRPIVPYVKTVHDRIAIEVMRGCTQGCRFCQAGMSKRPTRPRTVENILKLAEQSYANTGHNEISLTSLSINDYPFLKLLMEEMNRVFVPRQVNISFPSLRINEQLVLLPSLLNTVRKSGLTFALEAGSSSLRKILNKDITDEDLYKGAEAAFKHGWNVVKIYFMVGLPTETDEDIDAIAKIAHTVSWLKKSINGSSAQVNISIAPFVPKAHTPFQWHPMVTQERIKEIRKRLFDTIRNRRIHIKFHKPERSILEGIFARGDRRLGMVLYRAWKNGCKFDAWEEHFNFQKWMEAFEEEGIDWKFYVHRRRDEEEVFPWDHISCGIQKPFFLEERMKSLRKELTPDCRTDKCPECGSCSRSRNYSAV